MDIFCLEANQTFCSRGWSPPPLRYHLDVEAKDERGKYLACAKYTGANDGVGIFSALSYWSNCWTLKNSV